MIDHYQKIDKLNKQPLNQLAKRFLKKANQKPDPSMLYLYQLVEWGLESGEVEFYSLTNKYVTEDLLDMTRKLMCMVDPEKAMNLLTKEGPDPGNPEGTWVKLEELAEKKEPEEAAEYLAENLLYALEEKMESVQR